MLGNDLAKHGIENGLFRLLRHFLYKFAVRLFIAFLAELFILFSFYTLPQKAEVELFYT